MFKRDGCHFVYRVFVDTEPVKPARETLILISLITDIFRMWFKLFSNLKAFYYKTALSFFVW